MNDQHGRGVVIAGGGIAAVATAMAIADISDGALSVRVAAPSDEFVLRPQIIGEAWGDPPLAVPLSKVLGEFGAEHVHAKVMTVASDEFLAYCADGSELHYDYLVVATGADPVPAYRGAWTLAFDSLRDLLGDREDAEVAIVVPPGTGWTLPAYQLALLLAANHRPRSLRVLTWEARPLECFGPDAAGPAADLLARHGIAVSVNTVVPISCDVADLADMVFSLPLLRGTAPDGLGADHRRFIAVGPEGRVSGRGPVFAAGDVTAWPIKQGGLAGQQGEVVAQQICGEAGFIAAPRLDPYVLRGKLQVPGGEALHLRRVLDGADPGVASSVELWRPPGALLTWRLSRWLSAHRRDLPADRLGTFGHAVGGAARG
jgi:sulfide:quinone oxidoreductase